MEHNTMYSINMFLHTHMYTHMRIYSINLHNGKQTSESCRRVIHLQQMRQGRNMMNWFVGPELQGHK